jgi:hypothetical protein
MTATLATAAALPKGLDSSIDVSKSHDRPIVLGGPEEILSCKHDICCSQPEWDVLGNTQKMEMMVVIGSTLNLRTTS